MDLTCLLARWQNIRARLIETIDKFQTNELDFRPYPTSRSVRQVMLHIAPLDPDLSRVIHTPWGATYRLVEMVDHIIEHEVHHRAELSLILGILGRKGFNT